MKNDFTRSDALSGDNRISTEVSTGKLLLEAITAAEKQLAEVAS